MADRLNIAELEERIAPSVLGFDGGDTSANPNADAGAHASDTSDASLDLGNSLGDVGSGNSVDAGGIDVGGIGNGTSVGNGAGQLDNVGNVGNVGNADVGGVGGADVSDIGNADASDAVGGVSTSASDVVGDASANASDVIGDTSASADGTQVSSR